MEQNFNFILSDYDGNHINFGVNDTLLINFANNKNVEDEYCFVFENTENKKCLAITFISDIKVCCYFKHERFDGSFKFIGHEYLQQNELAIDISNTERFYLIIPYNRNEEIKTAITLTYLKAI